ncbi:reverse transcriptase domain-containing protein [Tanacetum coccineum]
MSASVVQQTTRNQKRSFSKQNLITHYRGKRKSKDVKEPEQKNRVQRGAIIGMVRGDTSRKRPREQSEQRASNDISFPSMLGCQLVDSPIILEALIECFRVRRISVDEGSSSEVMYEHCFRNLRAETKAKLKESGTPLVGFSSKVSYPIGTINLNVTMGEPGKLRTIPMKFTVVKSHSPYNIILGRTGLRSLGAVASTIHSMIRFPTSNGIATMMTKRETLQEPQRMEEAQGLMLERRTTPPKCKHLNLKKQLAKVRKKFEDIRAK